MIGETRSSAMNRKLLLRTGAAGLVLLAARKSGPARAQEAAPADQRQIVQQAWIQSLMENLDAQLDPKARAKLMEACGRACARRGAVVGLAKPAGGDLDKLLSALGKHIGKENATRDGNVVHLRYPKCYCPLVAAGPPRLSDTYCNCSRGWVLEVFEAVTGKPVAVELISSIKRGNPDCRFTIRV
jgi:predicted hydrocarbon binding protein